MIRTRTFIVAALWAAWLVVAFPAAVVTADDPKPEATSVDKEKLYAKFKEMVVGTKWKGRFTVKGRELDKLTDEAYEVMSATKLDDGEMWLLKARVKYGGSDRTYPVPIEVLWAGETPVLTMNKLAIPGVGTFSCRVVLDEGQYAGTWQHDAVGGHLFGHFEKGSLDDPDKDAPKPDEKKPGEKKPDEKK
jgi:hypothetical protein